MSWITLDDGILEHPKFIRAAKLGGSEAIHLWLGLRAYCARHLTDGFVPRDMVEEVRGPSSLKARRAAFDALVTVGLLDSDSDGVRLHDYLDWSQSRDDVLSKRELAKARQARSRQAKREVTRDVSSPQTRESRVTDASVTVPLPSPPNPNLLPPKPPELRALPEPDPEDPRAVAKRYLRDPMARELLGPPEAWAPVVAVLDAVSATFGVSKPSALPGLKDPRVKAIVERLSEGIPLASLLEAVRGAKLDDHLAQKPQFQTAATILRDSAQVDRFRALLAAPPKPRAPTASDSAPFDWRAEKAASRAAEAARKANEAEAHRRTMARIKATKAVVS